MTNRLIKTIMPLLLNTLQYSYTKDGVEGHIISAFRENGKLVLYDPQSGAIIKNPKLYLNGKHHLKMMRVDNLKFDYTYVDYILKGKNKNG